MKIDLEIKSESVAEELTHFIASHLDRAGATGGVLGLSGGLDSAVVAALAVRALGSDRVWAFILPYRTSSPESVADARLVAEWLGLSPFVMDITPQIDAYFHTVGEQTPLRVGNKAARERMSILYDQAKARGGLVLGTGNRTERLLGYCTLWGDMACDLAPIGGLYKGQVRQLASLLGVPDRILGKAPTADLWPGQTDEDELGVSYETADVLLHLLVDRRLPQREVAALGYHLEEVRKVQRLRRTTAYKRRPPPALPPPPPLRGRS